jgi:amino acid transporter
MAAIHPTHRTPVNAVHVQAVIGIVIAVGLGLWFGSAYPATPGPLNVYFELGYALGLLSAGMYMAVNVAVICY